MKFLLDVNVGTRIAKALTLAGHHVVRAALEQPAALDEALLARAVADELIVVTYDSDFGELIFRHEADRPPAVIYIRFEPQDVAEVVSRLLPLLDFELLNGHMVVIGPEHTRRVPFSRKRQDNGRQ